MARRCRTRGQTATRALGVRHCSAGASTARGAAFAWRALNVSLKRTSVSPEADERILGHATDPCHRIDIGRSARELLMRQDDQPVAGTYAPLVRDESGCASRRYEPASA
jgi:hypothetical protein